MIQKEGLNLFGLLGWSFGILGLIFSVVQPIAGILSGIVGLVFSVKQNKTENDVWSKAGKILSIVSIIVSIVVIILSYLIIRYVAANPALLGQIQ